MYYQSPRLLSFLYQDHRLAIPFQDPIHPSLPMQKKMMNAYQLMMSCGYSYNFYIHHMVNYYMSIQKIIDNKIIKFMLSYKENAFDLITIFFLMVLLTAKRTAL